MSSGPGDRDQGDQPRRTEMPRTGHAWARRPHVAGLIAVAVIALAGGAGVAYAVSSPRNHVATDSVTGTQSPTPAVSPSSPPSLKPVPPGGFGRFGGFGFGGFGGFGVGGLGGAIHGQVTAPKSGGGYQTVDVQRGTVTAVTSSSITVRSADGYSATYAVSGATEVNAMAAGIATVKVGDTVELTATVGHGTATAASVIDLTSIRASRGAFEFPVGPPAASQN